MGTTDGNRKSLVASVAAQSCPSADALSAFSSGRLSDQESVTIADHVTHCTKCDETLRGLAADSDSLARRLREAVRQSHPVEEPGCLRMQAAAKAIPQRGQESATMETLRDLDSGSSEPGAVERAAPLERTVAAVPQWSLAPPLPASVGRFQIRSRLGQGGFGTVYLAHDPDLDRPVAIKVPKFADEISDESVRSFLEEARTAARLKHPAIVAIYDVVRSEDKSCYIAMEYVEGESLKAALAQGKLPVRQAVQIIAQAAAAVHVAHKKGLVHRDLKPGNILLESDGHVKIADFGLAVHEDQQRSRVGEKAGTVAYMSPEQVRGDVHRLDGRSDIWSLGVLLYEMLTGRRPFSGTPEQIRDEILHRHPRPLRQIDDTIPAELEEICLKCLAKEADQRYSTAGDLAQALARWQRAETEPASPPRRRGSWPRWVRPILVLAGCVLVAAVAAAIFLPPEVPFRVDRSARLLEPMDLLDRPPEEIFAKAKGEEHWEHRFKRHVRMDSPTTTLLGLGTTQSDWYRLQVRMTKSGPVGSSGLILGLKRLPAEENRTLWECQAIIVSRVPGSPALLERELLTLEELPGRRFVLSKRNRIASVPLDDPSLDRLLLEVTVKGGQIADVRSQGKAFLALTDPAKVSRWQLPSCQGRFGITNSAGGTTFTDAKFESLRRPEP